MKSTNRITVLLAEDHMIVREGFRKMLELEGDFTIVGEAQDGRQAVAMVKKLKPEAMSTGIRFDEDHLRMLRAILCQCPPVSLAHR